MALAGDAGAVAFGDVLSQRVASDVDAAVDVVADGVAQQQRAGSGNPPEVPGDGVVRDGGSVEALDARIGQLCGRSKTVGSRRVARDDASPQTTDPAAFVSVGHAVAPARVHARYDSTRAVALGCTTPDLRGVGCIDAQESIREGVAVGGAAGKSQLDSVSSVVLDEHVFDSGVEAVEHDAAVCHASDGPV